MGPFLRGCLLMSARAKKRSSSSFGVALLSIAGYLPSFNGVAALLLDSPLSPLFAFSPSLVFSLGAVVDLAYQCSPHAKNGTAALK